VGDFPLRREGYRKLPNPSAARTGELLKNPVSARVAECVMGIGEGERAIGIGAEHETGGESATCSAVHAAVQSGEYLRGAHQGFCMRASAVSINYVLSRIAFFLATRHCLRQKTGDLLYAIETCYLIDYGDRSIGWPLALQHL
jgi:hypothetical protein